MTPVTQVGTFLPRLHCDVDFTVVSGLEFSSGWRDVSSPRDPSSEAASLSSLAPRANLGHLCDLQESSVFSLCEEVTLICRSSAGTGVDSWQVVLEE